MSRRALRWVLMSGFAASGFAVALLVLTAFVFPHAVVETVLAHALGRKVAIGALEIAWGSTISLRVRALAVAGDADASAEAFLSVASIDVRIDGAQLLRGTLAFHTLAIDKAALVLARNSLGLGNWRFTTRPAGHDGKGRTQLPDLGDVTLTDSTVRYRTSSGHWLVVALDDLHLRAEGSAGPIAVKLAGRYQGHAATLSASGASFDALREATLPYAVSLQLSAPQLHLAFDGTFADPLDVDGAVGKLEFSAARLGALQAFLDADATIAAALQLAGQASRHGDLWSLEAAQGQFAGRRVQAKYLALLEGPRDGSDTVTADVAFDDLDLNTVLARTDRDGGNFRPDPSDDALRTDLRVAVALLRYDGAAILRDMRLGATSGPGVFALREGIAHLAGGVLVFNARLHTEGANDGGFRMQVGLKGAQVELLTPLATGDRDGQPPVSGLLDAAFDLRMPGTDIAASLQRGQMSLAVAIRSGTVDRALVEAASTDLRALFRRPGAKMALECLFGVATLKDGIGNVGPVRVRAADGRFLASGSFDPLRRSIDILVLSDAAASGTLALDVPLRLQGAFGQMTITPVPGGRIATTAVPQFVPEFAAGNPCR
jgi:AsmA family protein